MRFDWDDGNRDKNLRHGVHDWEIEEALADPRRRVVGKANIGGEKRIIALGRSRASGKYLKVVYAVRIGSGRRYVKPISAVEMSGQEKRIYRKGL